MGLARVFAPSLPIGGVLTGTMTIDGSLAGRMTATADIEHREGAEITRMVANGEAVRSGKDGVTADMRFDPISLITAGKFAPALGLRGVASGTVHVGGSMRAMDLTADLHLPDGGELATTGTLDLASTEKGYDLETHLRLFNLRSVVSRGPVTSLTASAMAKGRGFDPKTMHAAFAANVLHSAVDSLAVDSANIRIAIDDGVAPMDSVTIHTPFAQLFVDGTIGTAPAHTGQLRYIVSVDTLAALRRWLASPDSGVVRQRPAIYAGGARAREGRLRAAGESQRGRRERDGEAAAAGEARFAARAAQGLRRRRAAHRGHRERLDQRLQCARAAVGRASSSRAGMRAQSRARGVRGDERRHAANEIHRRRRDGLALRERLRARLGDDSGDVRAAVGNGGARGVSGLRIRVSRGRGFSAEPRQQPGDVADRSRCSSTARLDFGEAGIRAVGKARNTRARSRSAERAGRTHLREWRSSRERTDESGGRRERARGRESRRARGERLVGDGTHRLPREDRGDAARARDPRRVQRDGRVVQGRAVAGSAHWASSTRTRSSSRTPT